MPDFSLLQAAADDDADEFIIKDFNFLSPNLKTMPENEKAADFTQLFSKARAGDRQGLDDFLPIVYDELKRLAAYKLSFERANHTLQPTALVNEAYLRLVDQHSVDWQNRAHFLGIASEMMRRILVNYAEGRNSKKRNEGKTLISLDEAGEAAVESEIDLIFLDHALRELAGFDPVQARVVELKFFGGLTNEEAAEVLDVSASTVKREWRMAKSWLTTKLT